MTHTHRTFAADAGRAGLLALALVLPFAVLEAVNQSITTSTLPLFAVLWLLPAVAGTGVFRIARTSKSPITSPMGRTIQLAGIAFVVVLAAVWLRLVADQLPCFLGVPNCD